MHVFDRRPYTLLFLTLVCCAEGPSPDADSMLGNGLPAAGSPKPDAGWGVPADGQSDSGFTPSSGEVVSASTHDVAPSMSVATASGDAATNAQLDANLARADAEPDANSLDASAPDAGAAAGDASSSAGSLGSSSPDATFARTEAGVEAVADSGAVCIPTRCRNRCLLLSRCCDTNNQCACLDPDTRMCTLESL